MANPGRPKGRKDSKPRVTPARTAARKNEELARYHGLTPLEMMVATAQWAWKLATKMMAEKKPDAEVFAMMQMASKEASQAAPYLHSRLSAVQMDGNLNVTVEDARRIAEDARAEAARRGIDFAPAERRAPGTLPN